MSIIRLETIINAPIERVFDLARSIDLHKISTEHTNEQAIAGKISGLINLNETVTWRAKHFGIYQKLTVEIFKYEKPFLFVDRMTKGIFSKMEHLHQFETYQSQTKMTQTKMIDIFEFDAPFGLLGKIIEFLFLKKYMTKFLIIRNQTIKQIAESEDWKKILSVS